MPRKHGPAAGSARSKTLTDRAGYWAAAKRPLQILAFLLPLIIAYELCLALLLPSGDHQHVNTVTAHRTLLDFFAAMGIARTGGLYLGGVVIVVVMLIWQIMARERWRVDPFVVVMMWIESLLLSIPLLVAGQMIANGVQAAGGGAGTTFADLDIFSQLALSVGAGLYEELIFRMMLIAVLHTLLVDVAKASERVGLGVAIVISAAAFTLYHDLSGPGGGPSGQKLIFYFLAGLYFGAAYCLRGFGIVVGVHALYDIITVLLPAPDAGGP